MWFTYVLLGIVAFVAFLYSKSSRDRKKLSKYPVPGNIWLIGNVWKYATNDTERLKAMFWFHKKFKVVAYRFLWIDSLGISSSVDAEKVLTSNQILTKAPIYDHFSNWLGTGLLTSTGEKWRKHRKIITPAFHFNILQKFVQVYNKQSDIFVEVLSLKKDQGLFNVLDRVSLCTLDIICESALNIEVQAQKDSESPYVRAIHDMKSVVTKRFGSVLYFTDFLFKLTPLYQKERRALKTIKSFSNELIQRRREQLIKEHITTEDMNVRGKFALLDLLLLSTKDGQPLTDQEIREEIDTFIFEGHDTVSSAISFTLYELSRHPKVQDKVMLELDSLLTPDDDNITFQQLQDMKYLEMVLKESMRLYPPVLLFGRTADESIVAGDLLVPKGVGAYITVMTMHRDPEVFPDPNKFDPERFSPENSRDRDPFAYIPFSAGQRNCIGQRFAMLEMKCIIAKVLMKYELYQPEIPHEVQLIAQVILNSANGIKLCLRERKQ